MLEIVLPVKQVPEPGAVRIDEKTGTVIRKGAGSVINPLDLHAVETALRLKDTEGAHIGLGVSGAIQHLIGMRTAETIAAVKKEGGRISGEHGIGHKRKKYMECVVSPEYLNMLRTLKRAFDPNNIMNPGKIFDLD